MDKLTIGGAKYFSGGEVSFAKYGVDDTVAIMINDPHTGERLAVASVNLEEADLPSPKHVWLKGWSENEGVPEALEKAGIIKRTGETKQTGFCQAELAEILVPIN